MSDKYGVVLKRPNDMGQLENARIFGPWDSALEASRWATEYAKRVSREPEAFRILMDVVPWVSSDDVFALSEIGATGG